MTTAVQALGVVEQTDALVNSRDTIPIRPTPERA